MNSDVNISSADFAFHHLVLTYYFLKSTVENVCWFFQVILYLLSKHKL